MLLQHVFILWPLSTPENFHWNYRSANWDSFHSTEQPNAMLSIAHQLQNITWERKRANKIVCKWKRNAKKDSKCQQKWLIYSVYNGVFGDSTMNCISIQLEAITKISFTNNDKLVRIESFLVISDTYKHTHTRTCAQKRPNYFQYYMNGV